MSGTQPPAQPPAWTAAQPPAGRSAWSTLFRMARPRATRANVFAALLATVLGFAIATQVQQTDAGGLERLREDELVRILDDVTQDSTRLGNDARALQVTRDRLLSGVNSGSEALRAAQQRADSLGILTGTKAATGPGIVLEIRDPDNTVTAALLLDALQELRDAGAEAVQIGDVRVVAGTWFGDAQGGVEISGARVTEPYVITAIGDSATLAAAMNIPGGVTTAVRNAGATSTITQRPSVTIRALHSLPEPRYARPVPAPSP